MWEQADMEKWDVIKIYTDGSCINNPWPGGYGAILTYWDHAKTLKWGSVDTTNNRMELQAVIEGLSSLKNYDIPVEVYTDSKYVKKWITQYIQKWEQNGWQTSDNEDVKNKDLWQTLKQLADKVDDIEWSWVKAHNGHHMNELVDQVAKKQAKKHNK